MSSENDHRRNANSKLAARVQAARRLFEHSRRHLGLARSQDGQALVEFAITFSVLVSFFFVFMGICLIFYSYNMISESAREGTRYASLHGSTCVTAAQASCTASASSVNTFISGTGGPNLGGGTMTPSTSFPDGNENPGSRVLVTVQYVFPVSLPFVPQNSVSMASTSEMYIVQ
jgi:Flp pilus assembly protein TadG